MLIRPLFYRTWQALLRQLHLGRHTAEEAITTYRNDIKPTGQRQMAELEAASWLLHCGQNPALAIERFKKEAASYPYDDVSDEMYEEIYSYLRQWQREGFCPPSSKIAILHA